MAVLWSPVWRVHVSLAGPSHATGDNAALDAAAMANNLMAVNGSKGCFLDFL